ncbi:MAG TPA: lasso peptide biosynthesis B2 protein [Polyangiales bacterium]
MFTATRALAELARKLRALPRDERSAMLLAASMLPTVRLVQSALPFKRWRPLLTRLDPPRQAPSSTPQLLAQAVDRARRGVPGVYTCLPVAYTGHLLLHHYGHPSTVQVGVARDEVGKVEAHAWVECEGRVLIGELPDLGRFVPFPVLRV